MAPTKTMSDGARKLFGWAPDRMWSKKETVRPRLFIGLRSVTRKFDRPCNRAHEGSRLSYNQDPVLASCLTREAMVDTSSRSKPGPRGKGGLESGHNHGALGHPSLEVQPPSVRTRAPWFEFVSVRYPR